MNNHKRLSDEHKAKIGKAMKGLVITEEWQKRKRDDLGRFC